MLLTHAGLLTTSLLRLTDIRPGFTTENVLTFRPALGSAYETVEARRGFYRQLEERLAALPDVRAVTLTATAPFGGGHIGEALRIDGAAPPPNPEDETVADVQVVDPRFFDTVDLRPLLGTTPRVHNGTPRAALINARLARTFFGDAQRALGRRIDVGEAEQARQFVVAGVMPDIRPYALTRPVEPMVFELLGPTSEEWRFGPSLLVRTGSDPVSVAQAIPDLMRALDPSVPVTGLSTLDQRRDRQLALPRLRMRILTVFAVSALLLACIGVYGVMSFVAAERTHEIGVRMALGARRFEILWWLGSRGAAITGAGLLTGALGARASSRLLAADIYAMEAFDPRIAAGAAAVLATVALIAAYLPARRASELDPVAALRED